MLQEHNPIYLDCNATTAVLPQVAAAVNQAMTQNYGNPSSSHITGIQAKDLMTRVRQKAKQAIAAEQGNIIFTSGATEGIQTAIFSALVHAKQQLVAGQEYCLLYGATEHKAVPNSLAHWNQILDINAKIIEIPVNNKGLLDLDFIASHAPKALLVCTMAVNNETGVYQNLKAIYDSLGGSNKSALWMVDCVQGLGKIQLDMTTMGIDYAPFSGHKLYAPKGIGFVYVAQHAPFTAFIAGGGQESGLRSGTENMPGLAALEVVFDALLGHNNLFVKEQQLYDFRQQLVETLQSVFPTMVINHDLAYSVATTINFSVKGFTSKEIMDLFDAANIRVSSGSACSSKVTRSFVLDAMGLESWQSESAIRLSFGPGNNQQDIDLACKRIKQAARALQSSCRLLSENSINQAVAADGLYLLNHENACCWIYVDKASKQMVVIDPLKPLSQRIENFARCQQLQVIAILDTHGHGDHQSARDELTHLLSSKQQCDHLGWPQSPQSADTDMIMIGEKPLQRIATPGHTHDSHCYLLQCGPHQSFAFVGDTILMGGLGRTNFDCSSSNMMYQSLQKLLPLLSQDTVLCCSHDYNNEFCSSLPIELARNSLLRQVSNQQIDVTQFIETKKQLDNQLEDQVGQTIVCGTIAGCDNAQVKHVGAEQLDQLSSDTIILDIREPHEYHLGQPIKNSINMPLSQLVNYIASHNEDRHRPHILICRSGTRSAVAASALVKFGFDNVAHFNGGYALN
ncbi:aminotransferase class V-fold PLP-dependent enzyme [Paraferrimonas sp. SM1919]|uniref:aminotransferase class V-fold PLP-dependent enzyme n=1 Tax=Paraferrimonas sp. SM1919 TaxID=2662263 RepID=UPI0013D7392C|nr:aminotransferase class V-fold PLP-dependent enzyme [Paraferrimonas sp. SM1919]